MAAPRALDSAGTADQVGRGTAAPSELWVPGNSTAGGELGTRDKDTTGSPASQTLAACCGHSGPQRCSRCLPPSALVLSPSGPVSAGRAVPWGGWLFQWSLHCPSFHPVTSQKSRGFSVPRGAQRGTRWLGLQGWRSGDRPGRGQCRRRAQRCVCLTSEASKASWRLRGRQGGGVRSGGVDGPAAASRWGLPSGHAAHSGPLSSQQPVGKAWGLCRDETLIERLLCTRPAGAAETQEGQAGAHGAPVAGRPQSPPTQRLPSRPALASLPQLRGWRWAASRPGAS